MTAGLSPSQLYERLEGITATDIAAICGVHPNRSAIDVWLSKTGQAPPFDGNARTKWGNLLEPVIRADYEERHGVHVETRQTLAHPERMWMLATPDGIVFRNGTTAERGLEIKCHTVYLSHLYGAPGTDEVPPFEICQCMWGMAVTGLKAWDLVAFIDGQTTDYTIDRDDDLIDMLQERALKFRVDHVLAGVPPNPDGSERYSEFLKVAHKSDNVDAQLVAIDNDDLAMARVERLRVVRDQIHALEDVESELVQVIKLIIGDNAGIEFPGSRRGRRDKITWKKSKDGVTRDYKAALSEVQTASALLVSGKLDEFKRAITVLDKFAQESFANIRATMTAHEIRELLISSLELFTDFAGETLIERHTTPKIGPRSFIVPKHWKTKAQEQ